jgi:HEAT repeat protein
LGEKQIRIIEALIQTLFGSSSLGRDGACSALGQLGREQPQVIEILHSALSSPDYKIRVAAARTLGLLGENQPPIVNTLLSLLSDPGWLVRSAAVGALGDFPKEQIDIVDTLIPLLADSSSTVRATTARVFRNILRENGDTRVIAALYQATYDVSRTVREAAVSALTLAQSDISSIGARIEELFRQCEYEASSSSIIFNALRDIAEKTDISDE